MLISVIFFFKQDLLIIIELLMISERQTRAHVGFEKKHGWLIRAFFQKRYVTKSSAQKTLEIIRNQTTSLQMNKNSFF